MDDDDDDDGGGEKQKDTDEERDEINLESEPIIQQSKSSCFPPVTPVVSSFNNNRKGDELFKFYLIYF